MKIRKMIFTTAMSALVCFGLCQQVQSATDTPDPGGSLPTSNTADGQGALGSLTTGLYNSAFGFLSVLSLSDGNFDTGVGAGALLVDNGGTNTAVGAGALFTNVIGAENTALGDVALAFNDFDGAGLGNNNTAVGGTALFNNVDGSENTAVGTGAGPNVIAGVNNTYVGDFVGTLAADESNTIRIGDLSENGFGSAACFIGGIFYNFQPVGGSVVEVTLDLANDKLGWDIGPNNQGGSAPVQRGAPVPRSAPRPGARPQRQSMLNDKVEKLQAT